MSRLDFKELQKTWLQYTKQLEHYPAGDRRRDVAEKNLEVLGKRRQHAVRTDPAAHRHQFIECLVGFVIKIIVFIPLPDRAAAARR